MTLSILGGPPSFACPLHVGRPNLTHQNDIEQAIAEVLSSGWLTNDGPQVRALETEVAESCGTRHAIVCCNGTVALELLIRAAGMTGEVIMPSYTFVATAHALRWQGHRPVFCDAEPARHTLDPGRVEELITPNTRGIIGVHVWGNACDTEALQEIGDRHGIPVAYDASHAFGCTHLGRPIGSFGVAEVFSFHATKVFHTLEGGCITTDNDELATKLRYMRNFGFEGLDRVGYLGTNGKMNEVCAAVGRVNLRNLDHIIAVNRRNHEIYSNRLDQLAGIRVLPPACPESFNYHYVVVEVDGADLTRDELVEVLHAENVLARKYFYPGVHNMEPYKAEQPMAGLVLPETDRLSAIVMTLPNGTAVSDEVAMKICDVIEAALAKSVEIRSALVEKRPE